ncbi:succinate dehydrogenase cytochrome b subunit [Neoasaia chiangmaiensis NBRC 101099]|nr:succinate dehydrogenase, cytochrome b556 subunit [Neoasaia chiangmaiensis]GBR39331.1 succinate dehydrogenase cytochrome b subunit [Neoasaia chiangmaiensis NBRC 101099]GEN14529.1 hypothetical protein NCH01_09600 [Neoasaia chiangmaiensis]
MASDGREALYQGDNSAGQSIRRPMSPHLGIYRFRLSMVLSITNRMAGVFSALGTGLAVAWLGALAQGPKPFARAQKMAGHPLGQLVFAGWSVATLYHLVASVRHLIWDSGARFGKREIDADGVRALGATSALAGGLLGGFAILARRHRKGQTS